MCTEPTEADGVTEGAVDPVVAYWAVVNDPARTRETFEAARVAYAATRVPHDEVEP